MFEKKIIFFDVFMWTNNILLENKKATNTSIFQQNDYRNCLTCISTF